MRGTVIALRLFLQSTIVGPLDCYHLVRPPSARGTVTLSSCSPFLLVLAVPPITDPNGRIRWQMSLSAGAIPRPVGIRARAQRWVRNCIFIGWGVWGGGGDV